MLMCKSVFIALVALAALIALPSPAVVQAQTADPATQLYVQDMGVTFISVGGPKRQPIAVVDIVDGYGNPVNGALVMGNWSGCFNEAGDSALTETYSYLQPDGTTIDVDGRAEILSQRTFSCWGGGKKKCNFTFTITGVILNGMMYVPVNGYGTSWSESPCM